MKILVPFRGESIPRAALPEADRLARALDGEIVLVALGHLPETERQRKDQKRSLKRKAGEVASMFDGRVKERIEPAGDPVRGILDAADAEKADMIVILPGGLAETDGMDELDLQKELERKGRIPVRLIGQEGPD